MHTPTQTTHLVDVPAIGGDVQVRSIPPKLLRVIRTRASTKGGGVDFNALMVLKLVYGLVDPNFTEDEAREVTRRFSLRTLQPIVDKIDTLSGTDEHLRHDELPHHVRKLTEPVVLATAWLQRFPAASRGRAPRPATNAKTRGSRRATASSNSSGDPPSTERVCARDDCGEPVVRTGSRGPWPKRCPVHRDENRSERARRRQRKRRGTQQVLVSWTKLVDFAGSERHTHVDDAGPRERTYSIVNLDLAPEQNSDPEHPVDAAQARLDQFVTDWLVHCEERAA